MFAVRRLTPVGFALAFALVALLLAPLASGAAWVEPVVGPLNQTNAFATAIRGNGSEPLVGMLQVGPTFSSPTALVASLRSSAWQPTTLDRNPGTPVENGPALTPSGPVYASWIETRRTPTTNAEVYVARYLGGGSWTPVGASLNHNETNNAQSSNPTIANVGSAPWVAWQEAPDNAIWVARLNGGQVSYVGGSIPVGNVVASPSLTSINGVPYLAYYDGSVHVVTLVNGRWVNVPGLVAPGGSSPTIANVAGRIFLAWTQNDGTSHTQLHAARYVGNGHWLADASLNVDRNETASFPQVASVAGIPWVVWTESSRPFATSGILYHVYARQFNGASWQQVGGVLNVDPNQSAYSGGISDVGGNAYVAMTQSQTDGGVAVRVKYAQGFAPHVSTLSTQSAHTTNAATGDRATRFAVGLDEPATIRLDFTQAIRGRLDRGVCVTATKRNAHARGCALTASRGQVSFNGHSGVNTLLFAGALSRHKALKHGTYDVVISALDASGLRSAPRTVRVTF